MLCTPSGELNPDAKGFTRKPLHTCNLFGHWPRKKKWNWWGVGDGRRFLSLVLADLDYMGLAGMAWIDLEADTCLEWEVPLPLAMGLRLKEKVHDEARFRGPGIDIRLEPVAAGVHVRLSGYRVNQPSLRADLLIRQPPELESLGVVIPWDDSHFQYTSKHNSMPATGRVQVGQDVYHFPEGESFGFQDFGRGIWPYQTHWNWATGVGQTSHGLLGLQFGGKWTDGTGFTENGLFLNGKLHKIHQRINFHEGRRGVKEPWLLVSEDGKTVRLELRPQHLMEKQMNLGAVASDLAVAYGRFNGKVRIGGQAIDVENLFGWAEEHKARW